MLHGNGKRMAKHLGCDPLTVAMKVKSQAWIARIWSQWDPCDKTTGSLIGLNWKENWQSRSAGERSKLSRASTALRYLLLWDWNLYISRNEQTTLQLRKNKPFIFEIKNALNWCNIFCTCQGIGAYFDKTANYATTKSESTAMLAPPTNTIW